MLEVSIPEVPELRLAPGADRSLWRRRRSLRPSRRPVDTARATTDAKPELRGRPLAWKVNDEIRKAALVGAAEPVPFFCECSASCFHVVWLDVMDYDTLRWTPNAPLLAPDHGEPGAVRQVEASYTSGLIEALAAFREDALQQVAAPSGDEWVELELRARAAARAAGGVPS